MGWLIIKRIFLCLVVLIVLTSFVSATNKNQTHSASQILNDTFDYGSFIFRDNVSADYFVGNGSELIDVNRSVIVDELKDNRSSNILFNKNVTVNDTLILDYIKSLLNPYLTIFDDVVMNKNLNVTNINVTVINATYIEADYYFGDATYMDNAGNASWNESRFITALRDNRTDGDVDFDKNITADSINLTGQF